MTSNPSRPSTPVILARALFYLNAAIWLLLGVVTVARGTSGGPGGPTAVWILAILMAGNAAVMLWLGLNLGRGGRRIYAFAVLFLLANIVLTVTDQFGVLDLITLILDGVILALVIGATVRERRSRDTDRKT